MSATLHRRVPRDRLATLVPSGLRLLAASIPVQEPYALVVFTRRPVRVGHVESAIDKLGPLSDERLVVAGIDFTQEARSLASAQGAYVLEQGHHGWTESSHDEIRTVKRSLSTLRRRTPLRSGPPHPRPTGSL
jgi:hypothetical protein